MFHNPNSPCANLDRRRAFKRANPGDPDVSESGDDLHYTEDEDDEDDEVDVPRSPLSPCLVDYKSDNDETPSEPSEASSSTDTGKKRKSKYKGVHPVPDTGKWRGKVSNPLKKTKTGGQVKENTPCFDTEEEAYAAYQELDERVQREKRKHYDPIYIKLAAENPLTRDLPRAPEDKRDADPDTVYWNASDKTGHVPQPVVRGVSKQSPSGYEWHAACQHPGCAQVAISSGLPGSKAEYCKQHGGGLRCAGIPSCSDQCPHGLAVQRGARGAKYEQDGKRYCPRCFCYNFPEDARAIQAKGWLHAKEQTVMEFLKEVFPEYTWTFDKGFGYKLRVTGQRAFRPDARVDVRKLKRVVIVEVDEHSHRMYICEGERERERAFVAAAGKGNMVVMIRFNPDKYTTYDGKTVTSCWQYSAVENKMSVAPKKKKEWAARLEELRKMVANFTDPETVVPPPQEGRPCFTAELFYDNVAEQHAAKMARR